MTSTYGTKQYVDQSFSGKSEDEGGGNHHPTTAHPHPTWRRPVARENAPGLRVRNSLTSRKELFVPHDGRNVKWYTCGPTVYDVCHMGHARAYLTFDILRRIFSDYFHFNVEYHVNITDVDDKIILRARRNKLLKDYLGSSPSYEGVSKLAFEALNASKEKTLAKLAANDAEKTKLAGLASKSVTDTRREAELVEQIEQLKLKSEKITQTIEKCKAYVGGEAEELAKMASDEISERLDAMKPDEVFDNGVFEAHARKYEKLFLHDMRRLGVRPPDVLTRVTEYLPQIVEFVRRLVEKDLAYVSPTGSVYLDLKGFKESGHDYRKLKPYSGATSEAEMAEGEGALCGVATEKRDASDFVLWKASKRGEPRWPSPWGDGRPGWHIECSVVASDVLGERLDLHAGGEDLKFPHHDNELAQSECYFGCDQWVNYFVHAGHLQIKGLKMSKSLKNFVTIEEALEQHTARQLRMLFLIQPWDGTFTYSDAGMAEAKAKERRFVEFVGIVRDLARREDAWLGGEIGAPTQEERDFTRALRECQAAVHEALLDNMDTPRAMEALVGLVDRFHAYSNASLAKHGREPTTLIASSAARYVVKMLGIFGVEIEGEGEASSGEGGSSSSSSSSSSGSSVSAGVMDALVAFREEIRSKAGGIADARVKEEVLKSCDRLRDETLVDCGIQLEDRPGLPTRWMARNPAELRGEREEARKKAASERAEKAKRKLELEEKALAKEEAAFAERDANSLFRASPEFTAWDPETGIPTKDKEGKDVTKGARKTCEKRREKALEEWKKVREKVIGAGFSDDETGYAAYFTKRRADLKDSQEGKVLASATTTTTAASYKGSFSVGGVKYETNVGKLAGKSFGTVAEFTDYMKA